MIYIYYPWCSSSACKRSPEPCSPLLFPPAMLTICQIYVTNLVLLFLYRQLLNSLPSIHAPFFFSCISGYREAEENGGRASAAFLANPWGTDGNSAEWRPSRWIAKTRKHTAPLISPLVCSTLQPIQSRCKVFSNVPLLLTCPPQRDGRTSKRERHPGLREPSTVHVGLDIHLFLPFSPLPTSRRPKTQDNSSASQFCGTRIN